MEKRPRHQRHRPSRRPLGLERLEARRLLSEGPLVPVSGPDPFAGSTADHPGSQVGTNYPGSQVEPGVAVNPTDPNNLVAIWQQDRWSNGGARGIVVGVSLDGGATWRPVVVPKITRCSGGTFVRASDPWLSFAPDGTLFASTLALDPDSSRGFGPSAILVSRSRDGGLHWSDPITLIADSDPQVLNDKDSITADPTDSRYVYAVWDRPDGPSQPTMFARSTDGGTTWGPARPIDPNDATIGNQILVLPSGTLVDFFAAGSSLALIRSTDQGATWSQPIVAATIESVGVTDPDHPGSAIRTGNELPEVAVDPHDGNLYAVWGDARSSGFRYDSIEFSMSSDGGLTWSSPIRINQTPTTIAPADQQAFTPAVAVAADGTVAVTYSDFRDNTPGPGALADSWIVRCRGGWTDPAHWGAERRLTDTSFDIEQAPRAGGYFVGDYEGLAATSDDFLAVFSQPQGTDSARIYFRRSGPPPSLSITDVAVTEGGSGTSRALFTVRLSAADKQAVTVHYATADGTATVADHDYQPTSGTLTFAPGQTSQRVAVAVYDDLKSEPDEQFTLRLSQPVNAFLPCCAPGGVGTILNDENALAINDVTHSEGTSGTTAFTFTVTLTPAATFPVTVHYATADGTATVADHDYQPASGTLTFAPGQTSQQVTVTVYGAPQPESPETFSVNLSRPTNAIISHPRGIGTILAGGPGALVRAARPARASPSGTGTGPAAATRLLTTPASSAPPGDGPAQVGKPSAADPPAALGIAAPPIPTALGPLPTPDRAWSDLGSSDLDGLDDLIGLAAGGWSGAGHRHQIAELRRVGRHDVDRPADPGADLRRA